MPELQRDVLAKSAVSSWALPWNTLVFNVSRLIAAATAWRTRLSVVAALVATRVPSGWPAQTDAGWPPVHETFTPLFITIVLPADCAAVGPVKPASLA